MTAAMYSAIGGLKTHMSNLGVIGNNIANVNTQAYKAQRMTFQDSMYTMSRAGSDGSVSTGGNNPSQIGYGAQVGSIDLNMSPSTFSPTGYDLDCMISGEGFFLVGDKDTGDSVNGAMDLSNFDLTRMGDFWVDAQGYICDRRGKCLYGYASVQNPDYDWTKGESKDNPKTIISTELVPLRLPLSAAPPPTDRSDAWQEGDPVYNMLSSSNPNNNNARSNFSLGALLKKLYEYADTNTDEPTIEMTNADLFDEDLRDLGLTRNDAFTIVLNVAGGSITGVNSVSLPRGFNQTNFASSSTSADNAGEDTGVPYANDWPIPNGEDMCVTLTGMSVNKQGAITGTNSNGQLVTVGYIAIVNASANDGVTHSDGYYYKAGEGAGDMRVSIAGGLPDTAASRYMNNKFVGPGGDTEENQYAVSTPPAADAILNGGTTEIRNGGLEQSSTDIATEFANMILTQRGYQANTRLVTVTDSMLEELVNMKR